MKRIKFLYSVILACALAFLPGCATKYTFADLLLDLHDAAWLGSRTAVLEAPSSRDDLERAVAALKVVEASTQPSIPAIALALQEAGVKEIGSPLAGTIVFNRLGRVVDLEDYGKAKEVARSLREGIELGLAP
jgi:hypothetical protein